MYRKIWVVDFEFTRHSSGRPDVVCLAAQELHSGQRIALWRDQMWSRPPYDCGEDALFVCYSGMEAELACHLALGWPLPVNVVDLIVEYRMSRNGQEVGKEKFGLLEAVCLLDIPLRTTPAEKARMRDRILCGWPFSADERREIQAYNQTDTDEEVDVLRALGPGAMSRWSVWRGEFVKSVARMWWRGVPIAPRYAVLAQNHIVRMALRQSIIDDLSAEFPVWDGPVLKNTRLAECLVKHGIPIPLTPTDRVSVDQERLGYLARDYRVLEPLVEGLHALGQLREFSLPIGDDGRLRAWFAPFWTKTSRAAPSTTEYIYSLPAWVRAAMEPPQQYALIYFDWSAMEFGLAAAASGCSSMRRFYEDGDPYIASAIAFGDLAAGATKRSHPKERDLYKTGLLASQYGIGPLTLAARLKRSPSFAAGFISKHHEVFSEYWEWSDAVVREAIHSGQYLSRHGWRYLVRPPFNMRSLRNWVIQTLGADVLRTSCIFADRLGVEMLATAHDAVLVQAKVDEIPRTVSEMKHCMRLAAALLTDGFALRVDPLIKEPGERFIEDRAKRTLRVVDKFVLGERHA